MGDVTSKGPAPRGRGLALLGALLLGLVVVEVWVRVAHADDVDAERIAARQATVWLAGVRRGSADPELVFELVPDLDVELRGVRLVTDAQGFRVAPDPPSPSPHSGRPRRVAVLGASTPFGLGLPYEQSWPALARNELEELWERPVVLRNFAVPAYVTRQQVRVFEKHVLPWRPDLVIIDYDHRDALAPIVPGERIELAPGFGDNRLRSAALKLLLRRLRNHRLEQLRLDVARHRFHEQHVVAGPDYEAHLAAFAELAARAAERDLPVVVVIHDTTLAALPGGGPHYKALHRPLVPRLEALGLGVCDLFFDYAQLMEAEGWSDLRPLWLSTDPPDPHPDAAGQRLIAERLRHWINLPSREPGFWPAAKGTVPAAPGG